jgi:Cu+-exporting ATPase
MREPNVNVYFFKVEGMTCNGCRKNVTAALNALPTAKAVVNLEAGIAKVNARIDIPIQAFKDSVALAGDYSIQQIDAEAALGITFDEVNEEHYKIEESDYQKYGETQYYCPMFCEGDKLYEHEGRCRVCKMHLKPLTAGNTIAAVKEHLNKTADLSKGAPKGKGYYCPMQCEGDKVYPKMRDCPVCGMDLIATDPSAGTDDTYRQLKKKFIIALICTLPVFLLSMLGMIPGGWVQQNIPHNTSNWLQFLLSLPVVFFSGWFVFQRAFNSFKSGHLNMFSLIGLGAGAAFVYSLIALLAPNVFPAELKMHDGNVHLYFEAVAVILTLVLLGQLMEAKAHHQTQGAIQSLIALKPTHAIAVIQEKEFEVAVADLRPGNILRIKPGSKIPVDGTLTEGLAQIDESMLSGEALPVNKDKGATVHAGTINGNSTFLMKAEKVGADTLLAQIIKMVEDASRSRAPIQTTVDKVAKYFVPIVVFIAISTFLVWTFAGKNMQLGMANALAVLIVACPCALGLATPMSIVVGVGKGAKKGMLIKNAAALETMSKIQHLVVDKTGTLTEGKMSLSCVHSFGNLKEDEVLQFAAAVNQYSEHPLSKAVLDAALAKSLFLPSVAAFKATTGQGVAGIVAAKRILLGNEKLLQENNIELSVEQASIIAQLRTEGNTVSVLSINESAEGFIAIRDQIKPDAKSIIDNLQLGGVTVHMLSGDHKATAAVVAQQLGITTYEGQYLPQDKLEYIKRLQKDGMLVAMAGDGINDAPALAGSDIGIAMGNGTDVAIESAAIILLKGNLLGLLKLKKLSKMTIANIRQNLFFAFVYNCVGVPIAAGVLYPAFHILMSPMIAALAMSFSSVSVILNALRLNTKHL